MASTSLERFWNEEDVGDVDLADEDDDFVRLLSGLTPFVEPGGDFGHKGSLSDMTESGGRDDGNARRVFVRFYICEENVVSLLEELREKYGLLNIVIW